MATNATEIKAAVDLMQPEDFTDGVPKLDVVQRIAGDDTITAEAVAAALVPAVDASKPKVAVDGAAHTVTDADADKADNVDAPVDPNVVKLATAEAAKADLAEVQADIDSIDREITRLKDAKAEGEKARVKLETVIEANTVQFSEAEMVKRIQRQTQERLQRQAENRAKVAGVMGADGVRTFASPLDQALANGAKRSKVLQEGGKVFEAPHPRSPAGVAAYGNWVHGGQKLPA